MYGTVKLHGVSEKRENSSKFFQLDSIRILSTFRMIFFAFILEHAHTVPCGLVVRISGSHPDGRGSIPRMGVFFHKSEQKIIFILTFLTKFVFSMTMLFRENLPSIFTETTGKKSMMYKFTGN